MRPALLAVAAVVGCCLVEAGIASFVVSRVVHPLIAIPLVITLALIAMVARRRRIVHADRR